MDEKLFQVIHGKRDTNSVNGRELAGGRTRVPAKSLAWVMTTPSNPAIGS
jgi:hypothetical protein